MNDYFIGVALALWFGILTSISPCPLATNITAISYIGKKVDHPRSVFLAGLLYTLGRSLTYLVLGVLLVGSLLSAPHVSHMLQKYMLKILGPILILVGMFLLGLLNVIPSGPGASGRVLDRADRMGIWGAGLLGIVFALTFCPTSAALFFGSLIPLALRYESAVILPTTYGIATGLPVLAFAVLIAIGAKSIGQAYNKLVPIEKWARRIIGIIFIAVGIYYCLSQIFGVLD